MKNFLLFTFLFFTLNVFGHDMNQEHFPLKEWKMKNKQTIKASFLIATRDNVYLEKENHETEVFSLSSLSEDDQQYVQNKIEEISKLNAEHHEKHQNKIETSNFNFVKLLSLFLAILALVSIFRSVLFLEKKLKYVAYLLFLGTIGTLYSFRDKIMILGSDPKIVDEAFQPFKPNVATRWDNTYFYVESNGIPTTHSMMTGITGWQQQVPIPQCYTGANAWSIPLNPVIATIPVPVNAQHFTRGAIAVAVNGIAIFNPFTNTGVDALVDGQLDNWGGHCGRADDYHYHIAPLHLYNHTTKTLPIAYALDGFAIYGNFEPDGTAMKTLDANHGHYGSDNVYHYHGTTAFPYMIGNMVGKITEDATMQIIPQAAAKGVRPSGTPLKGAEITDLQEKSTKNGYVMSYKLNNETYKWDYNWDYSGNFTFNYINPDGSKTTTNYKGSKPCIVPLSDEDLNSAAAKINIFPNPSNQEFNIQLTGLVSQNDIKNITIFAIDGKKVFSANQYQTWIKTENWAKGVYLLRIEIEKGVYSKKIVVE